MWDACFNVSQRWHPVQGAPQYETHPVVFASLKPPATS